MGVDCTDPVERRNASADWKDVMVTGGVLVHVIGVY